MKLGEVEYTELHLREPTIGELEHAFGENPITNAIKLLSAVAGVPEKAVRQISKRDYLRAMEFLGTFTGGGRDPGESDSPT